MLTQEQIEGYRDRGYLAVENVLTQAEVAERVTDLNTEIQQVRRLNQPVIIPVNK